MILKIKALIWAIKITYIDFKINYNRYLIIHLDNVLEFKKKE